MKTISLNIFGKSRGGAGPSLRQELPLLVPGTQNGVSSAGSALDGNWDFLFVWGIRVSQAHQSAHAQGRDKHQSRPGASSQQHRAKTQHASATGSHWERNIFGHPLQDKCMKLNMLDKHISLGQTHLSGSCIPSSKPVWGR